MITGEAEYSLLLRQIGGHVGSVTDRVGAELGNRQESPRAD